VSFLNDKPAEFNSKVVPLPMPAAETKNRLPLRWVDCLRGEKGSSASLPVGLPTGSPRPIVTLGAGADGSVLAIPAAGMTVLLNGSRLDEPMPIRDVCTLQGDNCLLVVSAGGPDWTAGVDSTAWMVFDAGTGELLAETPREKVAQTASELGRPANTLACTPRGLDVGFSLSQAMPALASTRVSDAARSLVAEKNIGKHICPVCWTRFDAGDALSIAVHESLRGDPVLGADARLRFHPTRFNDQGLALDPMGLACTDLACPHCRRQMPPGFLEMPQSILSLIGAPSSGKSYFLAVATQVLQERLARDFGLAFKDGDPSGNLLLNQMRHTLFSATTPDQALLGKTALEGSTYEKLPRLGRMVSLPRPFIYTISRPATAKAECSVILYDNAGEHFEPGIDIHESPGALHVATSAGLMFLFDPTANARFKQRLVGVDDPQLSMSGRVDQQDSILAEVESRIKRVLGLAPTERIQTPLAFIVGKSDAWSHLLAEPLEDTVRDGALDLGAIDRNSRRVRAVLHELCPGLVMTAESLAANLRFFAVTSFGHSPVVITEGPNRGRIAPDPRRLAPTRVEDPVYWILHLTSPELIPSR